MSSPRNQECAKRKDQSEIATSALLQQARDAGGGGMRQYYVDQAQHLIANLDPVRHTRAIRQFQGQILALQGRRGDTEVAHLTRGEIVVPRPMQNPEVVAALERAANRRGIPLQRLSVGSTSNRINPITGIAEFNVLDWTPGSADDRDIQNQSNDHFGQAATEGATARVAQTGINSANVRSDYASNVHALDPYDNAGREALKGQARDASPPEIREIINKYWPDRGPRPGSVGSANGTRASADRFARGLGIASRGLAGVDAVLAAHDIATSDNPVRTTIANVGGIGVGMLGGAAGAAAGAFAGPGAFIASPAGATLGSSAGGAAGYKGGEALYDYVHDLWNKPY